MFKPHVDTPRSDLQIGSLVVGLPCEHEGGQLVVRHQGHSTTFDWSGPIADIRWAAFYSDCEHEVLEVTSGYRITLTYNLYVRHGLGELAGRGEALDAYQISSFKEVKDVLGILVNKQAEQAQQKSLLDPPSRSAQLAQLGLMEQARVVSLACLMGLVPIRKVGIDFWC